MLKNSSRCIVLWLFIQLLIEINCQVTSFKPSRRWEHAATFIDDKLYILGGASSIKVNDKIIGKQFFYLDVSFSFNTQELLWNDLYYSFS